MDCAIRKAEVPMGMMSCPRCRARFHYRFGVTREVVAQSKMLFRISNDAPAKVGKVAKDRAERSGNQGRGVTSALWRRCEIALRWTVQYDQWLGGGDAVG